LPFAFPLPVASSPDRRRGGNANRYAVALVTALVLAAAAPAFAQEGFGFHGGGTIDPDQAFFGMHFVSKPLGGGPRLYPGADVGFGNDLTLVAFHLDFAPWIELNPSWFLYVGGGPSVNIYRYDSLSGQGPGDHTSTDVKGGFDALVGFAHRSGLMLEMRVGSSYNPNLRFAAGFTFK